MSGGVRPTTEEHSGSNVVSSSFPFDRRSVNISARVSTRGFFEFLVFARLKFCMGINTLLPFLKEASRETFIGNYKGKTAAVDASCWLHKALTISVQRTGEAARYELAAKE